ncbi:MULTISPECIES: DUF3047 domain-containing protein [unclassified Halomonas]|uniref:DUF3047 domain-containing protein n=2 Tax=Halomonadaceae TaxID=28256 RepID=UPI001EF5C4D1|nr:MULTISPECIES: DUF3047 domain-containing protein [unclassified Halomonas]MCG7590118.1 DUF3047 domain-containing protein [Halomonas sp. McD50-5]MCG7615832.1 DUF3047 domain-containing protein [Halomonas sp. McD50-4]
MTFLISVNITHHASAQEVRFTPERIMTWPTRSFAGETRYRVVEKSGQRVLQTDALGQASARYLERTIDLNATPYLHWCWQVSTTYPGLDETTKAGDDYPARVYVARKTGLLPWQVESVNYVWASEQPQGAHWSNAFTDRAQLLALQSGEHNVGQWQAEVRDVRADYRSLFGSAPDEIHGIALMSDGDNAGGSAIAWFTHLGFSADATPPTCPY